MKFLKKIIVLTIVLVFNFNCYNSCEYDLDFRMFFESAIKSVNNDIYSENNNLEKYINPENAKLFLVLVTQIEMENVHRGEYYRDRDAHKKIEAQWKEWYRLNKCTFSINDVDSLYSEFYERRESRENVHVNSYKFPFDWKLLFTNAEWGITDFYGEPEVEVYKNGEYMYSNEK